MDSSAGDGKDTDHELIEAVLLGKQDAWEKFVHRSSDLVYSFCSSVFSPPELDAEYLNVFRQLKSDNFALLRTFNGRAPFSTFLTLKLRELFACRLLELFKEKPDRGWSAFQRFFKEILDPLRKRSADLYQEICLQLIDNDYRRIVSFDGRGSFAAYIRKVIDNLCLDHQRESHGRRRLPEAVLRLPALEQEIYRQVYWRGCREKDLPDILRDETGYPYAPARIVKALAQLQNVPLRPRAAPIRETSLVSLDGDGKGTEIPDSNYCPETVLVEAEDHHANERNLVALKNALAALPAELGLYVRLRFYSEPPKAPKEIARLMNRSERDIYKIRQEAMLRLRTVFKSRGLEKIQDLSV